MLKVEKLKVHGLPPLTFQVPGGECLAVEGPSGSGKSILLRAIADLDPASGHVFVDGAERNEMPAMEWRRIVRFIAAEPGWWGRTPRDHFKDPAIAMEEMQSLGLEHKLMDQEIASLSTGERQRLSLLRALADHPKVLLFDEPTSALDDQSAALVEGLVRRQILAGRHVLLVSHDKGLRDRLADAHLILGRPDENHQASDNGSASGRDERDGKVAAKRSLPEHRLEGGREAAEASLKPAGPGPSSPGQGKAR